MTYDLNNSKNSLAINLSQLLLMQNSSIYYNKFQDDWRKQSAYSLRDLFQKIQTVIKPKLFIEAGAHEANFSMNIKKILPDTLVYAFEADPTNYENFVAQKGQDFQSLGVNYLNLAIGSEIGTVTINRHKDIEIAGNNSLLVRKEGSEKYKEVSVSKVSLDAYFGNHEFSTSDFSIWIDVEGYAYEVLQGANKILEKTLSLFIEVEDKSFWVGQKQSDQIFNFLLEKEFIPIARDFEYRNQYNVIFLHPSAFQNSNIKILLESFFSGSNRL